MEPTVVTKIASADSASQQNVADPWIVRRYMRKRIVTARFQTYEEAKCRYRKSYWSAALIAPDGEIFKLKFGLMDGMRRKRRQYVENLLRKPLSGLSHDTHHWVLGTHRWGGSCWQQFLNEQDAMRVFKRKWWSKVVFDPVGTARHCGTGCLDVWGTGVAALVHVKMGNTVRGDLETVRRDLQTGRAAFIPKSANEGSTWKAVFVKWLLPVFARRPHYSCIFPDSLNWYDVEMFPRVRGKVALTIDDAPGRLGIANSLLPNVLDLLDEHKAKATFMLMGRFARCHDDEFIRLLKSGHELGNHGLVDLPCNKMSHEEFEGVVDECSGIIKNLQKAAGQHECVRWFRSPYGRTSEVMKSVLREKALTNVMCDVYACCPIVQCPNFIGNTLAQRATHGSIILLHMPEIGFREWCLEGLQICLKMLDERGFEVVSVSELSQLAEGTFVTSTISDSWRRNDLHGLLPDSPAREKTSPTKFGESDVDDYSHSGTFKSDDSGLADLCPDFDADSESSSEDGVIRFARHQEAEAIFHHCSEILSKTTLDPLVDSVKSFCSEVIYGGVALDPVLNPVLGAQHHLDAVDTPVEIATEDPDITV